jgi:hypothetical protein
MKFTTLLLAAFIAITTSSVSAQSDETFQPGYYIINTNAEFLVLSPGGTDYYIDKGNCYHPYDNLGMKNGEIVIAYEKSKGKYFCFDPLGRMVVFQGANPLTKAPVVPGCGVGRMDETIQLIDGSKLGEGSYFWIVGQNLSNSTIKIQVADGATYEVPQNKMTLISVVLRTAMDKLTPVYQHAQ